jgi:hypothetical protein
MPDFIIPFTSVGGYSTGLTASLIIEEEGGVRVNTTQGATFTGLVTASGGISAAGATFSSNIFAPNLVTSFNGSTGAVIGVGSFNGFTGAVKRHSTYLQLHESRSGSTAQSDFIAFTDFIGNNFSSSIAQGDWLGANANGGSFTISTASTTSYGFDKCNGVVNFITGTTSNTTGYAACLLQASHIPGIVKPSDGYITKYELECRFMTDSDVTSQDTKTRIGFADTWVNTIAGDGVYFERHYDSLNTPTETTFKVVFRNGAAEERIDTGVTFAASTIYRTYLCVERDTSGTITTSWEIVNDTTSVTSSGTAAPTNTARYPTASTDYINPGCIIQKTGSAATTTSRVIRVDYIGARIRRPLNRDMKLFA